ncbi:hypothetical protein [Gallibacterium genomosp. 3]|uniref:hypothetical protein n=1 Tax=Gallibacterium genomosp. 3 TaxID=505345 RepID=UPI000AD322DF|nr:hypothetical protein [Gallibacterium genomosp. 3]
MESKVTKRNVTANLPIYLIEWLQDNAKKNYRSLSKELRRCIEECMKNDSTRI